MAAVTEMEPRRRTHEGWQTAWPRTREGKARWGGPFLVGVLLVLLGVYAMVSPLVSGLAAILAFGLMLLLGGAAEVIFAIRHRHHVPFWAIALSGVLSALTGLLLFMRPMAGLAAASLLITGYFFAVGLFRATNALVNQYPHWGWDAAVGGLTFLLAVVLFTQWPGASLFLVGTLVGVELLFRGFTWVNLALLVRRSVRRTTAMA